MKVLMCGLGSIGQRHVRNMRQLYGNDIEIYAYRNRNIPIIIDEDMSARQGCPLAHYQIKPFDTLKEALDSDIHAVFITNPIAMHLEVAIAAAKNSKHLFIEKPIAATLDNTAELLTLIKKRKLTSLVAYQLRFHPAVKKIKALLKQGSIGRLIHANFHFGEWLPGMHPYEDYRTSHAARKNEGGGVTLCLSHEIDLARWLLGEPNQVSALGGKLSDLSLDVEDCVSLVMTFKNDVGFFPTQIHLNFIQQPPQRFCHIIGTQGSIYWNYYKNEVLLSPSTGEAKAFCFLEHKRNNLFLEELSHFFSCIENNKETLIPVSDALKTLSICAAAQRSLVCSNRLEVV